MRLYAGTSGFAYKSWRGGEGWDRATAKASSYNEKELPPGPRNYMQIVIRRLTVKGFILIDYFHRAAEAMSDIGAWVAEGKLHHAEDIQEGIENTPKTFLRLFSGANLGKQLLKVADPE